MVSKALPQIVGLLIGSSDHNLESHTLCVPLKMDYVAFIPFLSTWQSTLIFFFFSWRNGSMRNSDKFFQAIYVFDVASFYGSMGSTVVTRPEGKGANES